MGLASFNLARKKAEDEKQKNKLAENQAIIDKMEVENETFVENILKASEEKNKLAENQAKDKANEIDVAAIIQHEKPKKKK